MLFADTALARRIEHAEHRLTVDIAEAVRDRPGRDVLIAPIGGGAAVFAGPGSPLNKMIGIGFEGPLDEPALARIEEEFARRKAPLQVEISSLADPSLGKALTGRGYALVGFENVLGMRPGEAGVGAPARAEPGAVEVTEVSGEENDVWLDAVVTGFAHPDASGASTEGASVPREVIEAVMGDFLLALGFQRYLARVGGSVAGGASLRCFEGVAQLCGASTLPALRRRGVQTALLDHRLAVAARAGCDVAVVTTQPGSKSQANATRRGFALIYTRAILVREP